MVPTRSDLPMRIEKLATEEVVTAGRESSVGEIAELMSDHSVGSVVIVENDEPVGIVTDRDLAVELLASGTPHDRRRRSILVGWVTSNPGTYLEREIQIWRHRPRTTACSGSS